MRKTKFAYIAGIIDGEGHLTISKIRRPENSKTTNCFHYTANLGVTNTYLPLLKMLVEVVGGTYYCSDRRANKICYKWVLNSNESREKFLLAILPYLLEKREQAKLLLKFVRLHKVENPDLREKMYQEMKLLHHQKSVTTNTSSASEDLEVKIESDLTGDCESAPDVNQGLDIDHCPRCKEYLHDEMGHMCSV
jgi:hypothetical protein